MSQENQVPFVSVRQAATRSGLSIFFWRQAIASGRVPFIKSGAKIYVDFEPAMRILRGEEQTK